MAFIISDIISVCYNSEKRIVVFKVNVEKECGCFRRSGILNNKEFNTKDKAEEEAKEMCENMNESFCGKHHFSFIEDGDSFVIKMEVSS